MASLVAELAEVAVLAGAESAKCTGVVEAGLAQFAVVAEAGSAKYAGVAGAGLAEFAGETCSWLYRRAVEL